MTNIPRTCPCCGQSWPQSVPLRRAIGWRIRNARRSRGLSQGEVGLRLTKQRSHAAVSEIESGKTKIDIDLLVELATIFDVPISILIGDPEVFIEPDHANGDR